MAVSFEDAEHSEIEQLVVDSIESLVGASSVIASMGRELDVPSLQHARLHAVADVLSACIDRLEGAAALLDR